MSTDTETDYTQLTQTRIRLVHNVDNDGGGQHTEEVFGVVEVVNAANEVMMVREKGKAIGFLVEFGNIVEIEPQAEPVKVLKQKVLKPITLGQARQHLLDRHEWTLEAVNGLDDHQAMHEHDEIRQRVDGGLHQIGSSKI